LEPWRLLSVDPLLFDEDAPHASMKDAFEAMLPYIECELSRGTRLHAITRHFVGAFYSVPGARAFRRHLAEHGTKLTQLCSTNWPGRYAGVCSPLIFAGGQRR